MKIKKLLSSPSAWVVIGVCLVAAARPLIRRAHSFPKRPSFPNDQELALDPGEPPSFPVYSGCEDPQKGEIQFRSTAIVPRDFAKFYRIDDGHPEKVAELQLRFLDGYFNHDAQPGDPRIYTLPGRQIRVLSVRKTGYPRELDFDWLSDIQNLYPPSFRASRSVKAGAPAVAVEYEATQDVVTCRLGDRRDVAIKLPNDPFLAFWSVKARDRRVLRFEGKTSLTNPCAYAQMAHLPFPSMYWYVYDPDAHGVDVQGRSYDCRSELRAGVDYKALSARFIPKNPPARPWDFKALEKLPVLDVRMVVGLYSQQSSRKSLDLALALLKRDGDFVKTARRFESREIPIRELKGQDPSIGLLLQVVDAISLTSDLRAPTVEDRGSYLSLRAEGELKSSKKPLRLSIYFGSTDEPQKKAAHWGFLRDALAESPLIFYLGHSGMGENMSMEELKENLGLSDREFNATFSSQPYQMLMVMSCFANSYFGDDYLTLREGGGRTTDLIRTAVAESSTPGLPAEVLHFLDADLSSSKKPLSLRKLLALGLLPREMVLLVRQAGESP